VALEVRRRRAAQMFRRGAGPAEVAHALGVTRQSARRWYLRWSEGGVGALRAAPRAGRPPHLSDAQLRQLERQLRRGPLTHGFPTGLWTLKRVAIVIERLTGVRYPESSVWRWLGRMGWTPQRPKRRASERDDAALQHWKEVEWRRIKKRQAP